MSMFKFSSLSAPIELESEISHFFKDRDRLNNEFLFSTVGKEKDSHYSKMLVTHPIEYPFNIKQFDVLDEKVLFKTKSKTQYLYLNVDILRDSLFSPRFKFAGIRCENHTLVKRAYCHDISGQPKELKVPTANNVNAVTYVDYPSLLVVEFKMDGEQDFFNFSLLIDDMNDRPIEDFYSCDPQVGNDPPA
jgi:hypothetical protein